MKKLLIFLIFLLILFPQTAAAKIGVGVGTGKIVVDDELKPGTIYELPSLTVFNTGDESSSYEVNVAYHSNQSELRPDKSWFMFTPETFSLDPGESQEVQIRLNLPVRTEPGDYFAYLEGSPVQENEGGSTVVGIAAAAKLYFTVVPGSFVEGIYFKALSLWNIYAPWPQRVAIGVAVVIAVILIQKFFNIEINLKKSRKGNVVHDVDKDKSKGKDTSKDKKQSLYSERIKVRNKSQKKDE